MRRNLADVVLDPAEAGTEEAHRAAAALGDRFSPQAIIEFTNALTFLQSMGGQLYVMTLRERVDPQTGQLVEEDREGSEWRTFVMRFSYETQDARVARAKPPKTVMDVPASEFREPAVQVDADAPAELADLEAEQAAESEEEHGAPVA